MVNQESYWRRRSWSILIFCSLIFSEKLHFTKDTNQYISRHVHRLVTAVLTNQILFQNEVWCNIFRISNTEFEFALLCGHKSYKCRGCELSGSWREHQTDVTDRLSTPVAFTLGKGAVCINFVQNNLGPRAVISVKPWTHHSQPAALFCSEKERMALRFILIRNSNVCHGLHAPNKLNYSKL
jgi:hypothetical protein